MPKFRVTDPEGNVWKVNAPEGASEQEAISYVQREYATQKRAAATQELKQEIAGAAEAPLIAAGRTADKVVQGVKELGLGANVAAREAAASLAEGNLRMKPSAKLTDTAPQLRQMEQISQAEAEKDAAYQPLREKYPFLTGAGEAFPAAITPMGQATSLGRVFAPAAVAGVVGALKPGSPEERLKAGAGDAALAGVGGTVGEIARRVVSPVKSNLSAAQQAAVDRAAGVVGYKPRASDLTGSETLRRLEDAVARQPGGAQPMREFMDQNDRAISRHLAKGIGEDADALTSGVMGDAAERISGTYETLKGRARMPVEDPIFGSITKAEGFLTKGDTTGPKKEAFDMLQRLKDELYQSKEFDGPTYQSWSVDLGAKARELGKTNRTAAMALREVEKTMDAHARGSDAPLWQKTDRENAALEMLMKPGVVNEQTGKASILKLASNMERQFGKSLKTGKITGPNADVAALARAMPPMAEGSQTAGREAFGGLPGWMMAAPTYGAAKALTSDAGRQYLSQGLLGHPQMSRGVGRVAGRAAMPLTIAEIEQLLLGYQ